VARECSAKVKKLNELEATVSTLAVVVQDQSNNHPAQQSWAHPPPPTGGFNSDLPTATAFVADAQEQTRQERAIDNCSNREALEDMFIELSHDSLVWPNQQVHTHMSWTGTYMQIDALRTRIVRRGALLANTEEWREYTNVLVEADKKGLLAKVRQEMKEAREGESKL
jgi:hypothetical protein